MTLTFDYNVQEAYPILTSLNTTIICVRRIHLFSPQSTVVLYNVAVTMMSCDLTKKLKKWWRCAGDFWPKWEIINVIHAPYMVLQRMKSVVVQPSARHRRCPECQQNMSNHSEKPHKYGILHAFNLNHRLAEHHSHSYIFQCPFCFYGSKRKSDLPGHAARRQGSAPRPQASTVAVIPTSRTGRIRL